MKKLAGLLAFAAALAGAILLTKYYSSPRPAQPQPPPAQPASAAAPPSSRARSRNATDTARVQNRER